MRTAQDIGQVLCVDPDTDYLARMEAAVASKGYRVLTARGTGQALEALAKEEPSVVLTEVDFDDIAGMAHIRAMHRQAPNAVMVVHSAMLNENNRIDLKPDYVYEITHKPGDQEKLASVAEHAFNHFKERNQIHNGEQRQQNVLKRLQWLLWKERYGKNDRLHLGKRVMSNIRHSINQGLGVGEFVTLMDLLDMSSVKDGDSIKVNASMIESLKNSASAVRVWLESMDTITHALTATYPAHVLTGADLEETTSEAIQTVDHLRKIKDHKVTMGTLKGTTQLVGNRQALGLALRELLTNAFKYSPEQSEVHLVPYENDDHVHVAVLNDIMPMRGGITGVPEDYENSIFDPFVRLNNLYDDRFIAEELGMGIGLTVAQGAVTKIGGDIYVHEVTDYATKESPTRRIMADISLSKTL